jgi:hypothetical protein
MKFHAKNVEECWRIARNLARAYQRQLTHLAMTGRSRHDCLIARNVADRIALQIRYGRTGVRKRAK